MAEHEKKTTSGTQDVDEIRRKKKSPEPMVDKLKAQAGEPNPYAAILETAMDEPSPEKHAALLNDPRFSHSVNNTQKARVVTELQGAYGNAYVQRVVNHIQTKRDNRVSGNQHDIADIERRIVAQKGLGQPLATETRSEMEAAFKKDFSDVRLHTDASADKLSKELGAKAFTTGEDVFFREGAYQPSSEAGKGLLAHELTHVIQQETSTQAGQASIGHTGDTFEQRAERAAGGVAAGQHVSLEASGASPAIQRADDKGEGVMVFSMEEAEFGTERIVNAFERHWPVLLNTIGLKIIRYSIIAKEGLLDGVSDLFGPWEDAIKWAGVKQGVFMSIVGLVPKLGSIISAAGSAVINAQLVEHDITVGNLKSKIKAEITKKINEKFVFEGPQREEVLSYFRGELRTEYRRKMREDLLAPDDPGMLIHLQKFANGLIDVSEAEKKKYRTAVVSTYKPVLYKVLVAPTAEFFKAMKEHIKRRPLGMP